MFPRTGSPPTNFIKCQPYCKIIRVNIWMKLKNNLKKFPSLKRKTIRCKKYIFLTRRYETYQKFYYARVRQIYKPLVFPLSNTFLSVDFFTLTKNFFFISALFPAEYSPPLCSCFSFYFFVRSLSRNLLFCFPCPQFISM